MGDGWLQDTMLSNLMTCVSVLISCLSTYHGFSTVHSGPNQGFLSNRYIIKYGTECWSVCRVAAECAHGCCRMCAGLQSYQIFSQISQKYFLAQKNILSKKWPPKQNLKGVSKSYIGLCNHSGPLYKVTWWCMVVQELPKALLKMASCLISPSGHCGQLCIGRLSPLSCLFTSPSCWETHFLYLSSPPSGNLLPIVPWLRVIHWYSSASEYSKQKQLLRSPCNY